MGSQSRLVKSRTRSVERALIYVAAVVFGLVVALFIAGCVMSESDEANGNYGDISYAADSTPDGPLQVAVQYNLLSVPVAFAYDRGYFTDEGLEVELTSFVNGAEENKVLETGIIDVASNGLASVNMLATGKFLWVGESDDAMSTVAVYMREDSPAAQVDGQLAESPNVKGSADTLRGITVVGQAGTMEEWVAVSYLAQFGLVADVDYTFVDTTRAEAVENVLSGQADMFVATDNDYKDTLEDNGFVVVAEKAEATGVPFNNGYLVSKRVLDSRHEELLAFLKAVYRAADELAADPQLRAEFTYEYYQSNGKTATMDEVRQEIESDQVLVPADFNAESYRLGAGVLDVGRFYASVGALGEGQVEVIEQSIDPQFLDEAFGMTVQTATLE